MLTLDDLMFYRDKALSEDTPWDFVGWELPSEKVIVVHPWIAVFDNVTQIPKWPGATLRLQTVWINNVKVYEPASCMKPTTTDSYWLVKRFLFVVACGAVGGLIGGIAGPSGGVMGLIAGGILGLASLQD